LTGYHSLFHMVKNHNIILLLFQNFLSWRSRKTKESKMDWLLWDLYKRTNTREKESCIHESWHMKETKLVAYTIYIYIVQCNIFFIFNFLLLFSKASYDGVLFFNLFSIEKRHWQPFTQFEKTFFSFFYFCE